MFVVGLEGVKDGPWLIAVADGIKRGRMKCCRLNSLFFPVFLRRYPLGSRTVSGSRARVVAIFTEVRARHRVNQEVIQRPSTSIGVHPWN